LAVLVVEQVPGLEAAMHPWSRYCLGMLNKSMKCVVCYLYIYIYIWKLSVLERSSWTRGKRWYYHLRKKINACWN
jgi:hypothetical protein